MDNRQLLGILGAFGGVFEGGAKSSFWWYTNDVDVSHLIPASLAIRLSPFISKCTVIQFKGESKIHTIWFKRPLLEITTKNENNSENRIIACKDRIQIISNCFKVLKKSNFWRPSTQKNVHFFCKFFKNVTAYYTSLFWHIWNKNRSIIPVKISL